jgi:hypothetical protein
MLRVRGAIFFFATTARCWNRITKQVSCHFFYFVCISMHEVNGNVQTFASDDMGCCFTNKSAVKLCCRIFYIYVCEPPATARNVTRNISSYLA